ncbi:hypothetical protein LOTGIDRAFT_164511 [Lottia gigantea]|uniref:G-protein coupled receptors family 1 profile domain-containing protein n=1 Tax=Lottia gigantea TaxID=225164 RepID=V4AA56_LOTGI|nr:hypothetical protein LOTGIDRAFT_164511 [Lottia gigantea]ESO90196.1 hypothetical protein LOTGIDRAFT_164511 [Lottia gigantea]
MNNSSYLNDMFPVPANTTVASSSNQQIVVNAIIGGLVFLLCLFTFTSILLTKSLRNKEKVCYLAIICSDLVLSCQILFVRLLPITFNSDHPLCHFQLWNGIILTQATMFSNMMVTTERFVSVVLPFRFSEKVTCKRLMVVYAFLWVAAIVLTFVMFSDGFSGSTLCQFLTVGNRKSYAILGSFMCSIVIVDFSLYVGIIKVARRHIRQIAATMVDGNIAECLRAIVDGRTDMGDGNIRPHFMWTYKNSRLHTIFRRRGKAVRTPFRCNGAFKDC